LSVAVLKAIWFVPPVIQGHAERRGLLERAGLTVEGTLTRSSDEQFEALRDGRQDAAVTAMDNVIMWNRRPGGGDFRIVAQVEANTGISLVAQVGFGSIAALAGERLLVDSAENGFVVALRALLADAGVDFAACDVIEAGGVKDRFDRLLAGEGAATLLGPPFTEIAEAKGLRRLADADAVYPGFPGQGLVVRQRLIDQRGDDLGCWLGALEQARSECRAQPEAVAAGLAASGLPQPVAERLAGFVGERLTPSPEGLELLIGQRRRLGLPGGDASRDTLVDLRPLAAIC
jgi:ABC-type nitrate/sulfonate/bicarbonate transport system substrate-binding protein